MVVSPLSAAELLAQLGGSGTDVHEAYVAIQTIWNWVDPANAIILDWPMTFVGEHVFDIPTPKNAPLPNVSSALNTCSQPGLDITKLREAGRELWRSWNQVERKSAEARRTNTLLLRHHKIKTPRNLLVDWCVKILQEQAHVTPASNHRDKILEKLSAYLEMEIATLTIALRDHEFKFLSQKRMNDQADIEQLVYLADDRARYLTCDKAYKRLSSTSQWNRITIEKPHNLMNATSANSVLERMLSS
jgi:hypothetical protein